MALLGIPRGQTALGAHRFHPPSELCPGICWAELILVPLLLFFGRSAP